MRFGSPTTFGAPTTFGDGTITVTPGAAPAASPAGPTLVPGTVTVATLPAAAPTAPGPQLRYIIHTASTPAPTPPGPDIGALERPPVRVDWWAVDDDGSLLCPLPEPLSWDMSLIPGEPGAVTLTYPRSGAFADVLETRVTAARDLRVEIRTDGTRDHTLGALLQTRDGDAVAEPGSASIRYTGAFLTELLRQGALPYNTLDPGGKGETQFAAQSAGGILDAVLDACQDDGDIPDLWWTFTSAVDSAGTVWPSDQRMTVTLSPGDTPLEVAQMLREWGLIEFEVTTQLEVRVFLASNVGTDLTLTDPPLVLRAGRDLTEAGHRTDVGDAITDLIVAGAEGVYVRVFDAAARARRGRQITGFISEGSLKDQTSALVYARTALAARVWGQDEQTAALTFDPRYATPLKEIRTLDWLYQDTGSGLERRRVAQLTVSLAAGADRYRGGVVLGDLMDEHLASLNRRLDRLRRGSTVIGTSQPPAVDDEDDTMPPAVPTGLVVGSEYLEGEAGQALAVVSASWATVTENADGTPIADLAGYRVRWRQVTAVGGGGVGPTVPWTVRPLVGATSDDFGTEGGVRVQVQVQAVDRADNASGWSATVEILTETDTSAPPVPSAPVVSDFLGVILAEWDGRTADGADMLVGTRDFAHVEVHVSATSMFIPHRPVDGDGNVDLSTSTTYVDRLAGPGTFPYAKPDGITQAAWYATARFVRLVAVDRSGNPSAPSGQGSATPSKLVNINIGPDAIQRQQIVDLEVITAKLDNLAVNDAKLMNASVGKLTAGTFSAAMTLSGIIRTATTGLRVEIDSAGLRLYNGANTNTVNLSTVTGDALVTGTYRSGMAGERINVLPDGTLRMYGSTGTDYFQIANDGDAVRFRSRADGSGRRSFIEWGPGGVTMSYGLETGARYSRMDAGVTYGIFNAPVVGLRVFRQHTPTDGTANRIFMLHSNSGGDIGPSIWHYQPRSTDQSLVMRGIAHGAAIMFSGGYTNALASNDTTYGGFTADGFTTPSSGLMKTPPAEITREIGATARDMVDAIPSDTWFYKHDFEPRPETTGEWMDQITEDGETVRVPIPWAYDQPAPKLHVGPIAEDVEAVAPALVRRDSLGRPLLDQRDLVGVLWAALRDMDRDHTARLERLERGPAPTVVDGEVAA